MKELLWYLYDVLNDLPHNDVITVGKLIKLINTAEERRGTDESVIDDYTSDY